MLENSTESPLPVANVVGCVFRFHKPKRNENIYILTKIAFKATAQMINYQEDAQCLRL
jgi:hypothetical protein